MSTSRHCAATVKHEDNIPIAYTRHTLGFCVYGQARTRQRVMQEVQNPVFHERVGRVGDSGDQHGAQRVDETGLELELGAQLTQDIALVVRALRRAQGPFEHL